jgi:hypothetical protein
MAKEPVNLLDVEIPRTAQQTQKPRLVEVAEVPEPRLNFSTKLPASIQDRLRRWAYETRKERQHAVEAALDEWLKARGY